MTFTGWRDKLAIAGPVLALFVLGTLSVEDGQTVCPCAVATGVACPGCGMIRAASFLLRGDLGTALEYHPLVPLIAVQGLAAWAWYLLRRGGVVGPLARSAINVTILATAVALVAVWALRATSGTLPPV